MVIGPELSTDGTTPLVAEPAPGAHGTVKAIEGRSLGRIAWTRLKRDRVAMGGGYVVIFLILVAVFAPVIVGLFGSPPNEFHRSGGEWRVERPRIRWDILDAFRDAAEQCGIPKVDEFNRGDNFGCAYFQMNQKRGRRWSATRSSPTRTSRSRCSSCSSSGRSSGPASWRTP